LIYSTNYLARPNKKSTVISPKKLTGQKLEHKHNTQQNTQKQDEPLLPYPQQLCPISMAASGMAPNHGAVAPHESIAVALQ
jgi:hypothetical protein